MADGRLTFGQRADGRTYRLRLGAYGVALDAGRVLVVDAPEGRFLPGGAIEGDEDAESALRREVREETGHELLSARPLGGASQLIIARADGVAVEKSGQFFAVELSGAPVVAASEADHECRWLEVDEARSTLTDESHRWAVARALDEPATEDAACACPSDIDPRIARFFDAENRARREGRDRYVMGEVTRRLAAALRAAGPSGKSVLEAGCGPGALLHELLEAGASRATGLDLSTEAIRFAGDRLTAAGHGDKVVLRVADAATAHLPAHDWVVLDKVICCYSRVDALLESTLGAARSLYAFAIPTSDGWRGFIARTISRIEAATNSLRGRPCPGYVHDVAAIERRLADAGFEPLHRQTFGLWLVGVYFRPSGTADAG